MQESNVIFHVIGLKCTHCGSYNTCRAANPTNDSSNGNQTTHEPNQVSSSHEPNQASSSQEPNIEITPISNRDVGEGQQE